MQEKPGVTNVWRDAEDDGNVCKPVWLWATAFQNDFAARAAWCVNSCRDSNQAPIVTLRGPAHVEVAPGSTLTLDVTGSSDPDGNRLYCSWWQYREPGTFKGTITAKSDAGTGSPLNSEVLGGVAEGDTITFYVWGGTDPPVKTFYKGTASGEETIIFTAMGGLAAVGNHAPSRGQGQPQRLRAKRAK